MPTHRKPRPRALAAPAPRAAIGLTSAALATVTLLSESASAAPAQPTSQPSIQDVQRQVDTLNHQTEVAIQRYDQAQERTAAQRKKTDALLAQVAEGTQKLNDSRRLLGQLAAAQYRTGGLGQTAQFLLTSNPQQFFDQSHLMKRVTGKQQQVLAGYETRLAGAARRRSEAASSLSDLSAAQQRLAADKRAVQEKLSQAQELLNSLTAQQKARLAALQRQREEKARQAAEQAAKQQAASSTSSSSTSTSSSTSSTDSSYAARAAKAVAFAKAQLGKPYVWGATGPNSYDCSGLTQAAWAAAGVALPRTTWEQVKVGTRVAISDLQPGDLIFYYSDISHVAMYVGNGQMIQAPHTGAVIDIQPIDEMPIYGATRPA